MGTCVLSWVVAGPIDFDWDSLVPDLVKLGLILLGAVLLVLATSAVLLGGVTVGLTYLRRRRHPEEFDAFDDDEPDG